MFDLKALETELHHARLARLDAQSATTDVEEMIWQVQHFEPGRGRLCLFVESLDVEPLAPPRMPPRSRRRHGSTGR